MFGFEARVFEGGSSFFLWRELDIMQRIDAIKQASLKSGIDTAGSQFLN